MFLTLVELFLFFVKSCLNVVDLFCFCVELFLLVFWLDLNVVVSLVDSFGPERCGCMVCLMSSVGARRRDLCRWFS